MNCGPHRGEAPARDVLAIHSQTMLPLETSSRWICECECVRDDGDDDDDDDDDDGDDGDDDDDHDHDGCSRFYQRRF